MSEPLFDADLLSRYDLSGPRYTSYPTAPNFRADVGEATYRAQARASNADPIPRPLSIYVHIPFCASPCFYCGCNRVITHDRGKADQYLARLEREIAMQAPLFDRDRRVVQLHLGGGTPNFFSIDQLRALLGAIGDGFQLSNDEPRDFSIEIDPRFADAAYVAQLAKLGFNRVSYGVQDFNPVVQEAINRIQPVEATLAVIEAARANGFKSVNVDLIYGLPKQTLDGFAETLDIVTHAAPDRIALYSYAHLPEMFKAQRQIDPADLPTPQQKLALLGLAMQKLGDAGYEYIGMDHFALPHDELARARRNGSLQRSFQGYTTHAECDLVGLGMSAIGRVGDCYTQNARDIIGYYAAIDAGRLPVVKGFVLGEDDLLRNAVIQSLMCSGEVDIDAIERAFRIDFAHYFAPELARLGALAADALVEVEPHRIRVLPRGRMLMRIVAMAFDAYLPRPGEQRAAEQRPRFSRVI